MSKSTPLQDITKLGIFFGRVSEVHLNNLKSFPFIFFNNVKEVKLDYSITDKKEEGDTLFFYDLSLDLEENNQLEKRYAALESAVRSLFWKEAKIKVSINEKEVYKSE